MIVTWKSGSVMVLLILVLALLQNTFFSQLLVLGSDVWILPVVAVIFGLLGGSLLGAAVGFGTGLLADCLGDSPMGLSCLVFMAIGYLGGVYRERDGRTDQFSVIAFGAAAVMSANLAFGVYGLLVGQEAPLSWALVPKMLLQGVYGALITLPIYALIYRSLKPALILGPTSGGRSRSRAKPVTAWEAGDEA